jgi:hypothetical protein
MNSWSVLFCVPLALLSATSAISKPGSPTVPVKYEGGTLPLGQGRTRVTFSDDKVVFTQGHRKLAIPLQDITAISCNTDIRRRSALLGAVPGLHLATTEDYYVGLSWAGNPGDGEPASHAEGVFKLSSSDYNSFLATLERLTGKTPVDTNRVPTVVRYGL